MAQSSPRSSSSKHEKGSTKHNTSLDKSLSSQLRSVYEVFVERNKGKGQKALTAEKFVEFVHTNGGGMNLLRNTNSQHIKIFFEQVQQYGVSLSTIETHSNLYRSPGISEAELLDQAYGRIQKTLESFPGKWDDFVHEYNLRFVSHSKGISLTTSAQKRAKIRSLSDLHIAWNAFVDKQGLSGGTLSRVLDHVPSIRTEQVMMHAIYDKTRQKIDPGARSSLDDVVGSLDAYSDLLTVDDLVRAISSRSTRHPDQQSHIENLIVRNHDIYQAYQRLGGKGSIQGDFSQWDTSLQALIDRHSSISLASSYEGSIESIQDSVVQSQQMMKVLSPRIGSLIQRYPIDELSLSQAMSGYANRMAELKKELISYTSDTQSANETTRLRALEGQKQVHRTIELLRWEARTTSIRSHDTHLAAILDRGPGLDFDFSQLSKEDQCYLGWACASVALDPREEKHNLYNLDRDRYTAFVHDMFDPTQTAITIPTDKGESLSLPVINKGFLAGGIHPSHMDFKKIEEMKHLGFGIDVAVTQENESGLIKLLPGLFEKVGNTYISPSYRVRLTDPHTGEPKEGYLMNVGAIQEKITHNMGGKIQQPQIQDQWMLFDYPPTKPGRAYPTPEIIREGLTLTDDPASYQIEVLDKTLTLTEDTLDRLALGRALGDKLQHIQNPSQSLDSSWDDMVDSLQTPDPEPYIDSYERESTQTDDVDSTPESIQQSFLDGFKHMVKAPNGFLEKEINNIHDLVGKTLWLKQGESMLPPGDDTLPFWIKMTIHDINYDSNTISFVMHGTDNTIDKYEGKRFDFPLESKTLRTLETNAKDEMLYMWPDFDGDDITTYGTNLVQAGALETSDVALFGGLELQEKGFKRRSDGKDISYFANKKTIPDPNDENKTIDLPVVYNIKRIKKDRFIVKNPELSYSQEMDIPTLMIFLGSRGLQPMTKEEKTGHIKRVSNPDAYNRADKNNPDSPQQRKAYIGGWFSPLQIWSFFKDGAQKLKDGMENYNKKKTEDLTDVLLGQYGLYGKLAELTSFMPSVSSAFGDMHGDYMQERDKKVFDLINGFKEFLSANPDGETVVTTYVKGFLDNAKSGKIPTQRRDILNAGGAYLYMLEEHGDAYGASLAEYRGSGLWVRVLGGERHYKNYLAESERVRLALEADPTNNNLLEEYAEMEAKYIHQIVSDNPSFKTFFSKRFSEAVIGAKWKGNDAERINKTADRFGSQKDFTLNENLFGVKLKAGDIGKTVGHLKAMAMTAQSSEQIHKVRLYLLEMILSGIVLYQTNDKTKNTLSGIASKMGFIPGTWIKDANQQHKIHTLLDFITGDSFSKHTGYTDSSFHRMDYGSKIGDFHTKYKGWIAKDGEKVSEFLTLMDIKSNPDKNLLAILSEGPGATSPGGKPATSEHISMLSSIKNGMMNNNLAGADRDLQNKFLFTAPLAIPNSVISSQLGPQRNTGKLDSGTNKETAMKEQFWKSLSTSIPSVHMKHSERFFIEKFVALLPGVTDHPIIPQMLLSAQYHLKRGELSIARELMEGTLRAIPLSKGMNSLDRPIEDTLTSYVKFFLANLGEMSDKELLKAVNMDISMDIGQSSLIKPYKPHRDRDINANSVPANLYNKSLYSLKRNIINRGAPWDDLFSGSKKNGSTSSTDGKGVKINKKAVPVSNPSIYDTLNPTTNQNNPANARGMGHNPYEDDEEDDVFEYAEDYI